MKDKQLPVLDSTMLRIRSQRVKQREMLRTKAGLTDHNGVIIKRSTRDRRRSAPVVIKGKSNA